MDAACLEECQDLQHLAEGKFNFNGWVGIIVLIAEDAWVEYISSAYKMYCIFKQLLHWQDGYHKEEISRLHFVRLQITSSDSHEKPQMSASMLTGWKLSEFRKSQLVFRVY